MSLPNTDSGTHVLVTLKRKFRRMFNHSLFTKAALSLFRLLCLHPVGAGDHQHHPPGTELPLPGGIHIEHHKRPT